MNPRLSELNQEHDSLTSELREIRLALEARSEGAAADPTACFSIPDALSRRADELVAALSKLGGELYDPHEREAALGLISYWIHALYRAGWYRQHGRPTPVPDLAEFSPNSRQVLKDEDYPWPKLGLPDGNEDVQKVWERLAGRASRLLLGRRLIGVTGAAGCGRSSFIEHGLLPKLLEAEGPFEVTKIDLSEEPEHGEAGRVWFLSSLVRALGLEKEIDFTGCDEPALERTSWRLLGSLGEPDKARLLIVHDVSRIFQLSENPSDPAPSPQQVAFFEILLQIAADSEKGNLVVLDIQRDYLGRLEFFPDLNAALDRPSEESAGNEQVQGVEDGWVVVDHETSELYRFITAPALRAGLNFEAGLCERLVADHQGEPAALPLLLFTLRRLWLDMLAHHEQHDERRNMISWRNYRRVRSGRLALEIAAEQATDGYLKSPERKGMKDAEAIEAVRAVFMEMVRLLPGSRWWLDSASVSEIKEAVIESKHPAKLAAAIFREYEKVGLLLAGTHDPSEVRIVHPALVERWSRLVSWLEKERTELRLYWSLRADANEWNRLLREPEKGQLLPRYRRAISRAKRFWDRQSLLWRGSKLSEGAKIKEQGPHEQAFLKASRLTWRLTQAVWVLAVLGLFVGGITVLTIRAKSLYEHAAQLYLERGANLLVEGRTTSALPWFVAAENSRADSPYHSLMGMLPAKLRPRSYAEEMDPHQMAAETALRRLPHLLGYGAVEDGLISADISPGGRWAILGCRKQGDKRGQAFLWNLDDLPKSKPFGLLPEGKEKMSVVKVAFLKQRNHPGDVLAIVAYNNEDGSAGKIAIWRASDDAATGSPGAGAGPARPQLIKTITTHLAVMDFAVHEEEAAAAASFRGNETRGVPRFLLAVALGSEVKPLSGVPVEVHRVAITEGNNKEVPPQRLQSPDKERSEWYASRIAFSRKGALAVAYKMPSFEKGKLVVFEQASANWSGDPGWSGALFSGEILPVQAMAFGEDHEHVSQLALATANSDSSSGHVWLLRKQPMGGGSAWRDKCGFDLGAGILQVAFSPDNRYLLATASNGLIRIWRSQDAEPEALPDIKEGGWPVSAAWSPDGRWIATGNRDRHARLWEVDSGRPALPPLYQGGTVTNVAFAPDGLRFLATTPGSASVWATAPRERSLRRIRTTARATHTAMSADGHRVAVASEITDYVREKTRYYEVCLWDGDDLNPVEVGRNLQAVKELVLSGDGTLLAGLSGESPNAAAPTRAHVWGVGETRFERSLDLADTWGLAPAATEKIVLLPVADGQQARVLLTGHALDGNQSFMRTVIFAGRNERELMSDETVLPFRVRFTALSADGSWLALAGDTSDTPKKGMVRVYDVSSGKLKQIASSMAGVHAEGITCVAFGPPGSGLLATGSVDDGVRVFKVPATTSNQEMELKGMGKHTADITSVGFDQTGKRLVSTGKDSKAILWSVEAMRGEGDHGRLAELEHGAGTTCHALSEDGKFLAVGGNEDARLWILAGKQDASAEAGDKVECQLAAVFGHRYPVAGLKFQGAAGSAPEALNSLAHEGTTAPERPRAVEAHRWRIGFDSGHSHSLVDYTEMVTAQKVEEAKLVTIPFRKLEEEIWDVLVKETGCPYMMGDFGAPAKEKLHLDAAMSAAVAKDWRAAMFHLNTCGNFRDWDESRLRFALHVFREGRDASRVVEVCDLLVKMDRNKEDHQLLKLLAEAHLQLGRRARLKVAEYAASQAEVHLRNAEEGFDRLLGMDKEKSRSWDFRMGKAEIKVLRDQWNDALEDLIEAKKDLESGGGPAATHAGASLSQRIAALRLFIADTARNDLKKGGKKGQEQEELKQRIRDQRQKWLELVKKDISSFQNEGLDRRVRVAWPMVLGATTCLGGPVPDEITAFMRKFAEDGAAVDFGSFGALNTHAAVLLRVAEREIELGHPEEAGDLLKQARERLKEAKDLYERVRPPDEARRARKGRPQDWLVEALILLAERRMASDDSKSSSQLSEVRDLLRMASSLHGYRDALGEWRGSWNSLDMLLLESEITQRLEEISATAGDQSAKGTGPSDP